jgi:hypothetical protein
MYERWYYEHSSRGRMKQKDEKTDSGSIGTSSWKIDCLLKREEGEGEGHSPLGAREALWVPPDALDGAGKRARGTGVEHAHPLLWKKRRTASQLLAHASGSHRLLLSRRVGTVLLW